MKFRRMIDGTWVRVIRPGSYLWMEAVPVDAPHNSTLDAVMATITGNPLF